MNLGGTNIQTVVLGILFFGVVNGIIFKVLNPDCSYVVYRHALDVYILTL